MHMNEVSGDAVEQVDQEGNTKRTSVTLPAEVFELGSKRAVTERRSFSNYLTWLIERDARRVGLTKETPEPAARG